MTTTSAALEAYNNLRNRNFIVKKLYIVFDTDHSSPLICKLVRNRQRHLSFPEVQCTCLPKKIQAKENQRKPLSKWSTLDNLYSLMEILHTSETKPSWRTMMWSTWGKKLMPWVTKIRVWWVMTHDNKNLKLHFGKLDHSKKR